MNNVLKFGFVILIIIGIIFTLFQFAFDKTDDVGFKVKVGWMTTWAEPGFLAEALKRTSIFSDNNVNGEMVSFLYGPPMVEAAIAGELNSLFVGAVPTINLMSNSDDWVIVARLLYFKEGLMAREGSGIKSIEDLKGKKLGVPYGTGLHPPVIRALKEAGLNPKTDLQLINLKPSDHATALQVKDVDAVAWAEPSITLFEMNQIAYLIKEFEDIGFVSVRKSYAEKYPEEIKRFIKSIKSANYYVAANKDLVFKWFSEDSNFDLNLVKNLKIIEPNFDVKRIEEVDLMINPFWVGEVQKKIDFMFEEGLISRRFNLTDRIDLRYLE